jgi:aryl-alcohol dehydrogenase
MDDHSVNGVSAAVLSEPNGHFAIEQLTIEPPRTGEVLVRIVATGMCHTDAAVRSRDLPTPLPVVLGHEGAGIVEAVGPGVTKVVPGDHVVITINSCGQCDQCLSGHPSICDMIFPLNFMGARTDGSHALCGHDGLNDQFFGQSSFATRSLAHERNVVKVTKDVPLEILGPLACGVQTGAGSVINALRVKPGESFVVFGSGAVGLSAVMGAHVCGATMIIAVDINPSRLNLALELGATHIINGRDEDVVARIIEITGKGVHHSLDTTGNLTAIQNAIDCLRPGGVCGILGATAPGAALSLPVGPFMSTSKTLRGIVEGDVVPEIFIPQMIALYQQGRFPFDKLIRFYALDQINQALEDSEKGLTVKPVIRMPH